MLRKRLGLLLLMLTWLLLLACSFDSDWRRRRSCDRVRAKEVVDRGVRDARVRRHFGGRGLCLHAIKQARDPEVGLVGGGRRNEGGDADRQRARGSLDLRAKLGGGNDGKGR